MAIRFSDIPETAVRFSDVTGGPVRFSDISETPQIAPESPQGVEVISAEPATEPLSLPGPQFPRGTPENIRREISPPSDTQGEVGVLQQVAEPFKTFGQAFTQSLTAKPATALRGATAFTRGEAFGIDPVLLKTSEFLESLRNPNTKAEIEQKIQGRLFPVQEGDRWFQVDPKLIPEVINTWAANIGDQIPLMLMTLTGKLIGKAVGKPAGALAGLLTAVPAGLDPTDAVTVPAIATATSKIVEHLGGAAPLIAVEAGGFLDQAEQMGIDKDIAEKYARIFGVGSGAVEYAQVLWNLKAFKRLGGPAKKTILKRIFTELGGSLFEGVEEFTQEGMQNFFIGKAIDDQKARTPGFKAEKPKIFEGGGRAFTIGTGISLVTRGVGNASVVVRDTFTPQAQAEVDAAAESVAEPKQVQRLEDIPTVDDEGKVVEPTPTTKPEAEVLEPDQKPAGADVIEPETKVAPVSDEIEGVSKKEGAKIEKTIKTHKVDILPRKDEILTELDAAIAKAPLKPVDGAEKLHFEINGGINVVNSKEALRFVRKNVKALPKVERIPKAASKTILLKPVAAKQVAKNELVHTEDKEIFTDGRLLIVGTPPKGQKFRSDVDDLGKKRPFSSDNPLPKVRSDELLATKTKPAELSHFAIRDPEIGEGASLRPVPSFGKESAAKPVVIFKTQGKFVNYDQKLFNIIRNRFPDADFGISDTGVLIAKVDGKPVAVLMPAQQDGGAFSAKPFVPFEKPAKKTGIKTKAKQEAPKSSIQAAKNRVQASGKDQTVKVKGETVDINVDEDVPIVENPGHLGSDVDSGRIKVALEPKGKSASAREIIFQMEQDFDVPFRSRITHLMRKSIGHFEVKSKVIRLKDVRQLSTAVHELGHHLDHNFFNLIHENPPKGSAGELLKLGKDLYGKRKPPGGYKSEGVAEFVRIWVTDSDAETKAPVFNEWFENFLDKNPDVGKRLRRTRTLVEKWKSQGAVQRVQSQITATDIKGTIQERFKTGITKLETLLLDKFAPLRKLRDDIGASQLHPSEDPFEVATANANKSGAKAAHFALQGTTDLAGNPTGISLQAALAPVAGDIKNWTTWAVAARARLLHSLNINPGISKTDADFVFEKFKSAKFEKALEEFTAWNHRGLDYMVEAGAIEKVVADKIKERHTVYVPFKRAFKEGEIQGTFFGGKGFVETGSPVKKIKGSGRAIKDPIQESIKGMEAMISASQKSQVSLAMANLADRFSGVGDKIVRIPAPMVPTTFRAEQIKEDILTIAVRRLGLDPTEINMAAVLDTWDEDLTVFNKGFKFSGKENVISIVKNGKRLFYEVSPDLFNTLKGLDKFTLPWYLDFWMGGANRALRLGATGVNPAFALRNFIRDLATFGFTTNFAKGNFLSGVKGVGKDIQTKFSGVAEKFGVRIPKDKDVLRFQALGGELSSFILQDKNGIKHIKSTVLAPSGIKYIINTFLHPIDVLRNLVGITESGTRIGEFGPALKEGEKRFGKGSVDAAMFALNAAQDVTVNFSRSGTLFQILNQVIPFSNVAVQGPAKLIKTMIKNPIRSIRRAVIGLMIPAVWLWWINKDKEWWKNLPTHEKANYLHFENPNNPNEIMRFPVAFELGHVFQSLPVAALDAAYNDDPQEVKDTFKFALSQANPLDWPAAVGPIIDVIGNEDFAGRPIVPRRVSGRLPEDQFTPRTTPLMKLIGKQLKMSPTQLEFLVNSYSGGMYGRIARMLTSTADPSTKSDTPIIGTLFMRDPFAPRKQIEKFYERSELLDQKFQSKVISESELAERKKINKSRRAMSGFWKELRLASTENQRLAIWNKMSREIKKVSK